MSRNISSSRGIPVGVSSGGDLSITGMYSGALGRWLQRQKQMGEQFGLAEQPLREQVQLYAPGGGYGAGQMGLIEEEGRKAGAAGMAGLVSTGMSSGTTASGLLAQIRRNMAQQKLGVEDIRTERYGGALTGLASLRAQLAQLFGMVEEPSYAPAMGAKASMYGADIGLAGQQLGQQAETQRTQMQISSAEKIAKLNQQLAQQHTDTPRLDITGGGSSYATPTSSYTSPNIKMGPGYGPAFQGPTAKTLSTAKLAKSLSYGGF